MEVTNFSAVCLKKMLDRFGLYYRSSFPDHLERRPKSFTAQGFDAIRGRRVDDIPRNNAGREAP
jgi:hypothetical protein